MKATGSGGRSWRAFRNHRQNEFHYLLMMNVELIQARLSEHPELLRDFGVRSLHVFGSVARGDATQASDVDILVEFTHPVGLSHLSASNSA